jgi:hypothetical protein
MRLVIALVTAVLLLVLGSPARADEPLVKKVKTAIDDGTEYLIAKQSINGDWEGEAAGRPGGCTALVLLALLNAGVPPNDDVIQNGLKYLREIKPKHTYVVGLQTMVYCLAGENKERIQANVQWLLDARKMDGDRFRGWTYDMTPSRPDNSNTQYALLGLHEAELAGVPIDQKVWESIRDYYMNTQMADGGYRYVNEGGKGAIGDGEGARFTMTTAGLCGLIIAGTDLKSGRETPNGDGTWNNCGKYIENEKVTRALEWMGRHFPGADRLGNEPYLYYSLYGIERAGRLTGLRFLGEHDWYRVGCEFLVKEQRTGGGEKGSYWTSRGDSGGPIVSTSFALLFLSKGRTPILISKLTHDGKSAAGRFLSAKNEDNDWNNDRNDARHLVEFASRELFKRKPMGWQVFNAREADSRVSSEDLAAELLQSPIAYFNGHLAPQFNGTEKEMLRTFVRNGGLIFAEACCGSKEFDAGFRKLMTDRAEGLFPDLKLEELPDDHPVWTAAGKFGIPPAARRRFPLYGMQMGCKTAVIYSPKDLSCRWESNLYEDKGDNQLAFHLGANIIAYATGLEPPPDRLTQVAVTREEPAARKVPRGFLKVGLLKHEGDFNAAAQAMPTLMGELRDRTGLDVALKTDEVEPTRRNVVEYKFLYMHGRKSFALAKNQLDDLRFNLEHGGLLFADACCGSKTFDKSFRDFIGDLWPDKKYKLERIPLKDDLYGKELNGTAITTVHCRWDSAGQRETKYEEHPPALEGVKIKGRWAVIYSRWDIGCALEKHKSPDCLGHDYESAVKLGRAVVLYHLR